MAATSTSTPIRRRWSNALMAIIHRGRRWRRSLGHLQPWLRAQRYLLGLDAGNTVIKAVLFDLEAARSRSCASTARSASPAPGHVERDLDELWDNAREAIARLPREGRHRSAPTSRRSACAGHGNGLYLLDRTGEPLIGIQSLDTRAAGAGRGARRGMRGDAMHAHLPAAAMALADPRAACLAEAQPAGVYARAGTLLLCKDVVTFQLTGERVSDISDMSGAGFCACRTPIYDATCCRSTGWRMPGRCCRRCTSRPRRRAPSRAGRSGDRPCRRARRSSPAISTSSRGLWVRASSAPGAASMVAGSWSINQVFSDVAGRDDRVFMVAGVRPWPVRQHGEQRHLGGQSRMVRAQAGRARRPSRRPLRLRQRARRRVAPAHDDPLFHPFLYGGRLGAHRRGGFFGLAGWHGEGHMLRALFEGVMFEHRRHIEVLAEAGVTFGAALSGGGRAARTGRRSSPTGWACRSRWPERRRGRWAPR